MASSDIHNKDIEEHIKKNRPHLKANSISTYRNAIKKVYKLCDFPLGIDATYSLLYTSPKKVIETLKSRPPNIRKTYYAALVVYCGDKDKTALKMYSNEMRDDISAYTKEQATNRKSDQQKANWLTWPEVLEIVDTLRKKVIPLWKESSLTKAEYNLLQSYILVSCYTMIPPRRASDYINLKYRNDSELDNFYNAKKGQMLFRIYKTSKVYGTQEEVAPKILKTLINKWITKKNTLDAGLGNVAKSDYIFNGPAGKPFTNGDITNTLNYIFDKRISVSMLRHIFITDKLSPKIEELKAIAGDMGHSVAQQALYVKND
jgi:hypothetical protein